MRENCLSGLMRGGSLDLTRRDSCLLYPLRIGTPSDWTLFERNSRRVALTQAGAVFMEDAREILDLVEAAESRVRRFQRDGSARLNVGFAPNLVSDLLPSFLQGIEAQGLEVRLNFRDLSNNEMVSGIVSFSMGKSSGVVSRPLRGTRATIKIGLLHHRDLPPRLAEPLRKACRRERPDKPIVRVKLNASGAPVTASEIPLI